MRTTANIMLAAALVLGSVSTASAANYTGTTRTAMHREHCRRTGPGDARSLPRHGASRA